MQNASNKYINNSSHLDEKLCKEYLNNEINDQTLINSIKFHLLFCSECRELMRNVKELSEIDFENVHVPDNIKTVADNFINQHFNSKGPPGKMKSALQELVYSVSRGFRELFNDFSKSESAPEMTGVMVASSEDTTFIEYIEVRNMPYGVKLKLDKKVSDIIEVEFFNKSQTSYDFDGYDCEVFCGFTAKQVQTVVSRGKIEISLQKMGLDLEQLPLSELSRQIDKLDISITIDDFLAKV